MQCKCFHLWKCSKGFNGIQVVTHISPRGTKTHGSKTFPTRIIFSLTLHHPTPWTSPPAGRLSTAVSDAVVVEEKLLQTAVFPQSLPQGLAVSGRQHRDGLQSGSVWHWLWSLAGWITKKTYAVAPPAVANIYSCTVSDRTTLSVNFPQSFDISIICQMVK